MRLRSGWSFVVLALGLQLGCGDALVEPPGVVALYGPPAETVLSPYPSDRYTAADAESPTGRRVRITPDGTADLVVGPGGEETVAELNALDGFSVSGGIALSFSGPLDVTGIAPEPDGTVVSPLRDGAAFASVDSPILLIDVDTDSPERGKARGLIVRYWAQPADDYFTRSEFTLLAQPTEPLRPRTRYLFVGTDALRAADGGPVSRSSDTDDLIERPTAGGYDEEVARGLDELAEFGVSRERVVLASVFTTLSVYEPLLAGAKLMRQRGAPKLLEGWSTRTAPTSTDPRAELRAVFESPEFRSDETARFVFDAEGKPSVQHEEGIEVFLAASDAKSTKRRPVVIFQHGLGGDKDGTWGTAERLAALDAAVIGIDSPHHGARAKDASAKLTAVFRFFGIDAADQSFVIGKARDNFGQMALDQLGLVELIRSLEDADLFPPGAPDGFPDFDTSNIVYIGHSFGSVQGPTIFALAPELRAATWNVGGDLLTTLMRDSATFSVLVNAMRPSGVSDGELARFFSVIQAIMDPGDPVNFARYGTLEPLPGVEGWAPRDALLQVVIDDNIVPNSTSDALARAAGLTLMSPLRKVSGLGSADGPLSGNLPSGATGVVSQFNRMNGDEVATHGSLYFAPEAVQQYAAFFSSALSASHATAMPPAGQAKP